MSYEEDTHLVLQILFLGLEPKGAGVLARFRKGVLDPGLVWVSLGFCKGARVLARFRTGVLDPGLVWVSLGCCMVQSSV